MIRVLAIGTCCVDVYPDKNEFRPGGEALNIAAHLSRRDDTEVFIRAHIGTDAYGAMIRNELDQLPVEQRDFAQWEDVLCDIDFFFSSADRSMRTDFAARSQSSDTIYVLTFGAEGSVTYQRGAAFECPAQAQQNVVDTTGCGDCFQAHLVTEYLEGQGIVESMQKATVAAAEVTQYVGGYQLPDDQ